MIPGIVLFYSIAILIISCTSSSVKEKKTEVNPGIVKKEIAKPPATYQDTLWIHWPAAVFYHPDSFQLRKIKEITDKRIFEGSTHEYFFQMRNARIVLNKNWAQIKIIEAKNVRYLLFIKNNKDSVYIDLDTRNDSYGLFLFDPKKDPEPADMMNIDSQLSFYFTK